MDFYTIITFFFIVSLMVMSPGPNGALILKTVTLLGKTHGYVNVTGIFTAFYLHGTFSIFGLSAILVSSAKLFLAVKIIGALYLAYLGIKAILSAFKPPKSSSQLVGDAVENKDKNIKLYSSFFEGLLTNLLNPKVSIFYLAAFPQFINIQENVVLSSYILVSIHALFALLWFSSMVVFVGKSSVLFKSHKSHAILQSAIGSVLLWFSYRVATVSSK